MYRAAKMSGLTILIDGHLHLVSLVERVGKEMNKDLVVVGLIGDAAVLPL
jgi:hypothetical protein